MKLRAVLLFVLALALSACGPIVISVETPQPSSDDTGLPDLVISNVYLGMQGVPGGWTQCVPAYGPLEVRAIVENRGLSAAENVVVVEQSTSHQIQIGTMQAQQSVEVQLPLNAAGGAYVLIIDPQNTVREQDETNNISSYIAATPTPPALCQPTQPNALPTDFPTQLPPTPYSHSLEGLIYADMNQAQIWKIGPVEQAAAILNGIHARFSSDGTQALFEQNGDIWLAEPMDNPGRNITNSLDLLESSPQWWPANPGKVVFNVVGIHEAQEKGWAQSMAGYVVISNTDGTDSFRLSSAPSLSRPALSPDAKTLAYDLNGRPALFEVGSGERAFDPALYGYTESPETGTVYTSPSFSPDGRWLTWWISHDESIPQRTFSLVKFDLVDRTSTTLLAYKALSGTLGWLDNPLWSPGGQWIAFQTRGEQTPFDLWVMHSGGGMGQRFGLATDPIWSPDNARVAFVQWPPRSDSNLSASLSVIEVPTGNIQQTPLPPGSIPLAWVGP